MTRLVAETIIPADEVEAATAPRRGMVAEREDAPGRFSLIEGPVRSYERTVDIEIVGDGSARLRQVVEYQSALRYWGWLFHLPLRHHLGRVGHPHRSPWWTPPDRLDTRAAEVLDQMAAITFIGGFLATLMTQTATFAADEFGASDAAQGWALAATRSAALLTLPIVAIADRRGRRTVIVIGLFAGPVLAATGALSPSIWWLAASQTLTRSVSIAMGIAATVMLAEEMPAGSRAYGVSLVSMAAALGVGQALFALPLSDVNEQGWRMVYVVSLLALPLAWSLRRHLTESKRFARTHINAPVAGHGRRLWLLAASGFLVGLFGAPASQFQNEFLRDDLGFTGGGITLFLIATNTPGAIGIVVGGRLAERGRRPVGAFGLAAGTIATVAMFASQGWPVWMWSVAGAVLGAVTIPALGVYGPELFPTSLRGKVNGIITVVSLVGSVIGLVAVGSLSDGGTPFGDAFALMAIGPLVLAVIVLLIYPETAHRTLEDLNPEDAPEALGLSAVDRR